VTDADGDADTDADLDTAAVRRYLLANHGDVVSAVRDCARRAAGAATEGRSDTGAVRRGTEAALREAGVWSRLPAVLAGCVEHAGGRLRATPVAAPPYVAPTATGVVLRATLDGGRLVVAVDALAVERGADEGVVLRPREGPPAAVVRVEWRG
jgi:hypothetical protein